ncbi:MAG: hypothetical protein AAB329_01700 [Pseudomonadota bacterium]
MDSQGCGRWQASIESGPIGSCGGGEILACGTCLKIRAKGATEMCPLSTMADLHQIIRESDKVVTF